MDSSQVAPPRPGAVHLWSIRLNDRTWVADLRRVLSDDERARADAFYTSDLHDRYVNAHGWLRRILGAYLDLGPEELVFVTNDFGKPDLDRSATTRAIAFNLTHSGDLAVVAVTSGAAVGVDIERWHGRIGHLEIAERFFSLPERAALNELAARGDDVIGGFFAAWTRKEAYIKATGHGITRGLDHFDVTLTPGTPARLIADRLEHDAPARWTIATFAIHDGYSGAVAVDGPVDDILHFDVASLIG